VEAAGLGRDPTAILFQIILDKLRFAFQEGCFVLDATPAFLEVGVTDLRLALSIPGGRQDICFVSESLEGGLEGVEPEGGQRGEYFQEPGKTEVE
jgi:hypothetical protein